MRNFTANITDARNTYPEMVEALRRFFMFAEGKTMLQAWTGLGTEAQYRNVVARGWMESVFPRDGVDPKVDQWWKLTESGAAIIQSWIDSGVTIDDHFRYFECLRQLPIPVKGRLATV